MKIVQFFCFFLFFSLFVQFFVPLALRAEEVSAEAPKRDLTPLVTRAESGDAAAQVTLGLLLTTGKEVEKDEAQGVAWFEKAAGQNDAAGIYYLAHSLLDGRGIPQDSDRGMTLLHQAADRNFAPAKMFLGKCCVSGLNVKKDVPAGIKLLEEAAAQENAEAEYILGVLYSGVEKDVPENRMRCLKWLTLAASHGFVPAQTMLGKEYLKAENFFWAREWLYEAARTNDDPEAHYLMALQEQNGWGDESAADQVSALKYLQRAAVLGHSDAQFRMGVLSCDGGGSEIIGTMWFQAAALQGNKDAEKELKKRKYDGLTCGRMGLFSLLGNPKIQDPARAKAWFERAIASGNNFSYSTLGTMYWTGAGMKPDPKKAMECFEKGAELGDVQSTSSLAMKYYVGNPVPQDFARALELAKKVENEEEGADALTVHALCTFFGDGTPRDPKTANELFRKAAEKDQIFAVAWIELMKSAEIPENVEKTQFLELVRKAAEGGNRWAQVLMGEAYCSGWFVPVDFSEMMRWFRLAAEQGVAKMQFEVFANCTLGVGTEKNLPEAQKWLDAACAKNLDSAAAVREFRKMLD